MSYRPKSDRPGSQGREVVRRETARRVLASRPAAACGAALTQAVALLLLATAVVALLAGGVADLRVAVAFGALIAVGEAVRVGHPGGREHAPLGAAAALAYALLGPLRGLPTGHGTLQVVAVSGAGLAAGTLLRAAARRVRPPGVGGAGSVPRPRRSPVPPPRRPHRRHFLYRPRQQHAHQQSPAHHQHRRSRPRPLPRSAAGLLRRLGHSAARRDEAARRLLSVAFAAILFQPLYNSGALDRLPLAGPMYGVFLTLVAALAALFDAVLAALQHHSRARPGLGAGRSGHLSAGRCAAASGPAPDPVGGAAGRRRPPAGWAGRRFGAALEDELRALPAIGSAIAATGILVSLAAGEVGLWALPVFCTPLLLAQASFRRAAAIRATYGQTIATLARATEVAGYTSPGHARRVADTACALGRELGLSTRDLVLLEYAALMHDIGQLSLVEPVPDGATATLPAAEQQRIARLGSEVIRRTGVPARVCEEVARLADPPRGPDGRLDRTLPLAARIIRVANAHDDLLGAAGHAPVLAALRAQCGQAYDPVVVAALARLAPPSPPGEPGAAAVRGVAGPRRE